MRRRTIIRRSPFGAAPPLAAVLSVLLGCAGDAPDDDAAICEWAPTLVAELGAVEDPRSVQYPNGNAVVRRARDGRVFVMEHFDPEILVYAPDGSFAGTIGRRGDGPGELGSPTSFILGPGDSLWVTETGGAMTVLAPDGSGGRTLASRAIGVAGIADFTASGDLVLDIPSRSAPGWAEIRDRDGGLLDSITGGLPTDSVRVTNAMTGPDGIVWNGDASFLKRRYDDPSTWIERWSPDGAEQALSRAEVVNALASEGTPVEPDSTRMTHITRAPDGAVWGLARTWLVDLAAVRPVMAGGERGMGTANQQNEWHDGILFRWDPADGSVRARTIDELPDSFADGEHYVTYREDDATGLIIIQLWRVPGDCPEG